MAARLRQLVAPTYLLLCLLLGGSIQGVGFVLTLQLLGLAAICWAAIDAKPWSWRAQARALPWIAGAFVVLGLLQLVPLPPALWTALPGREGVAEGYRLLGQPLPWRPLSLSPDSTVGVLLTFIPPVALVMLVVKAKAFGRLGLLVAILLAAFATIGLGILQVGNPVYYLYPWVALNSPAGLFANPNHSAALLLVAVPFVVAFAARRYREAEKNEDRIVAAVIGLAILAVLGLGIVLNGSLAIVLLGLPVAAASAFLVLPEGRVRMMRIAVLLAALVVVGGALAAVGLQRGMGDSDKTSLSSRQAMWDTTGEVIADHGALGTGLGTFAAVYRLYEDVGAVDRFYVNHAHNDYLELVLEVGVPGVLVILLFIGWWIRCALAVWRSTEADSFARAATIASATLMLHSAVDFPLRTAALAAMFGLCLGLLALAERQFSAPRDAGERARHRRIEDIG